MDKTLQPSYIYLPANRQPGKKIPIVVFLHTWSTDLEQRFPQLEEEIAKRGWILLEPNFRGRNDHAQACGSVFAQRDILDALSWAKKNYEIDEGQIYLTGFSGGGYLTMLMVMRYPKSWTAASAWCGISDLLKWYEYHKKGYYGELMRKCFGGPPDRKKIVAEYRMRSPIKYFSRPLQIPLDIEAGRNDTIVPPQQSIDAFNALAVSASYPITTPKQVDTASLFDSSIQQQMTDPILGRRIYLRRQEGKCRIIIFDGGHEWIPAAAMKWFDENGRSKY